MRKISFRLLIIFGIVVALTVSASVLATPDILITSDDEDEVIIPEIEVLIPEMEIGEEPTTVDDEEEMIADEVETVEFRGGTIILTESVKDVVDDTQLKDDFYDIAEWEASPDDDKMVTRDVVLKEAIEIAQGIEHGQNETEKVNIALVMFSDLSCQMIPEFLDSLTEIPVWWVTFDRLEVRKGSSVETDGPNTAPAVVHMAFDAYSGKMLFIQWFGLGRD